MKKKGREAQKSEVAEAAPNVTGQGGGLPLPGDYGRPGEVSIIKEESKNMEWERRLEEQQGHRHHLQVQVQEAKEQKENEQSLQGEMEHQARQHPWLDKQTFDGIDPSVNPAPDLNTDARTKFDNERREQEKELRLRLENRLENSYQNRPSTAPTPKGP